MKPIMSDKTETVTTKLYLTESNYSTNRYIGDIGSTDSFRAIGEAEVTIKFKMYDLESMSEQARALQREKLEAEIAERQDKLKELNND